MLHCQRNGLLAMSNHPNRGGVKTPFSNPAPEAVLAARIAAGLTQAEAGRLVRSTRRSWQEWESGGRKMPPSVFELFALKTQAGFTVADVLREVSLLAADMLQTRAAKDKQVWEGLTTICQQHERFTQAASGDVCRLFDTPDAIRRDAALWARDGYMMMSAGLPDTMTQEQNEGESDSGWGTAHIIKKMFGTQAAWAAKVAAEYGNPPQ